MEKWLNVGLSFVMSEMELITGLTPQHRDPDVACISGDTLILVLGVRIPTYTQPQSRGVFWVVSPQMPFRSPPSGDRYLLWYCSLL